VLDSCVLNQLSLTSKQSLKFLDAFSFRLKNQIMFTIRHCDKVNNTVVMFHPIQVMNNPSMRQRFVIRLFPNKDMFRYVTLCTSRYSSWMFRFIYVGVTIMTFVFTTFPRWVQRTHLRFHFCLKNNHIARTASFGTLPIHSLRNGITTINAKIRNSWRAFTPLFSSTYSASFRLCITKFSTISARMSDFHSISASYFICISHNSSITHRMEVSQIGLQ